MASAKGKPEGRGRQGGKGSDRLGLVELEPLRPCRKGSTQDRGPLADPDAEAFCQTLARVVLRIKGLAGRSAEENAAQEVQRESA